MEGLQLIDLGNEVSYIDIDTSKVPYKFSVKLDDRTFTFCIRYNEQGGFFTADLSVTSTGEVLVYGDIIRYGRPLFNTVEDERFPVPVIIPRCLTGDNISEVTLKISARRSSCTSTIGRWHSVLEKSSYAADWLSPV